MKFDEVLAFHAELYPKMRVVDAVKLAYQNEFGGGHLITDPEASLYYLRSEAECTPSNETLPLTVPIGNGLVRVNIAAATTYRLDFERLNDMFVQSARLVEGNLENFLNKLEVLRTMTEQGMFEFDLNELDGYLAEYAEAGYPIVSHSEIYRQNYAPAYRVVLAELLDEANNTDSYD